MSQDPPIDRSVPLRGDRIAELVEIARRNPDALGSRLDRLTIPEQVELALRVPPARRLDLLLHGRKARTLIRALPDAELYLTVREVGPVDAMPLLALASTAQLVHVLDLESWRGDRFDADRAGAWLALVLEADDMAAKRLLRMLDDEVLALLAQRWMRIVPIHAGEVDPLDTAESTTDDERGHLTPDGHHRFAPAIHEHAPAIRRLLQILFGEDPNRFRRILRESQWALPTETEEQGLHWRQSRLEEHGYPTLEDSLSVYAPPSGARATFDVPAIPEGAVAPVALLRAAPARVVLVPAIDALGPDARARVLFEFVAVANRVLVADAGDPGDPAAHRAAMETAAGYVTIALETHDATSPGGPTSLLAQVPAIELFRQGYARAAELGVRARALVHSGWARVHPSALDLLDTPIRERVEALLGARPKTARHAPFASLAEIEEARAALEMAEVVGRCLIDGVGFDANRLRSTGTDLPLAGYRLSTALLTLLAWHATRQTVSTEPVPIEVAADFLRTIASRRTAGREAGPRALDRLVQRLAQDHHLGAREIAVMQAFGRFCLERLADECGDLDPGVPLDRRASVCLLVE